MNEKAFEKLYEKFKHYMKRECGYLTCPSIYDIREWERFKEKQKTRKEKVVG